MLDALEPVPDDGGQFVHVAGGEVAQAAFHVRPDALNRLSIVRGSLTNLAKRSLSQLTALVKTRLKRMQHRPGLLDGFLASTGLDLTPFCNPTMRSLAG